MLLVGFAKTEEARDAKRTHHLVEAKKRLNAYWKLYLLDAFLVAVIAGVAAGGNLEVFAKAFFLSFCTTLTYHVGIRE